MPVFARLYHLSPGDLWALTLDEFLLFCEDLDAMTTK